MILPFSLFSFLAKEVADCWVGLVGIDVQVFFLARFVNLNKS